MPDSEIDVDLIHDHVGEEALADYVLGELTDYLGGADAARKALGLPPAKDNVVVELTLTFDDGTKADITVEAEDNRHVLLALHNAGRGEFLNALEDSMDNDEEEDDQ